ncbi:MAG: TIGR01458 family HAD-type hydrolase [Calditrichales bacterium]|nr:MAG: TIGR01458 family HAD-type hydrolase [Calditrichales bacterium]
MMRDIKALLIDLDGVIYNDTKLIDGAVETISWLQSRHIPFRFLTNTTMKSRETLCKKLAEFGILVQSDHIFTSVYAAVLYIRHSGKNRCQLVMQADAKSEFSEFEETDDHPDFIVLGDLGDQLKFEAINHAFQNLFKGAQLLALQKNRYWLSDSGYTLDAGAWVAMLEYASRKKSQVMGKPSPHFFALALSDLKLEPEEVLMIGDDIESDIKGAQRMGIKAVLVKTGKFRPTDLRQVRVKPWAVIENLRELEQLLGGMGD